MLEHTTHHLSLTLAVAATGPVFVPLLDVPEGSTAIESQCVLAIDDLAAPVDLTLLLAPPGTGQGAPPDTPLATGALLTHLGPVQALPTSMPRLPEAPGVLGIALAAGMLPVGTRIHGTMALVREVR